MAVLSSQGITSPTIKQVTKILIIKLIPQGIPTAQKDNFFKPLFLIFEYFGMILFPPIDLVRAKVSHLLKLRVITVCQMSL